MDYLYIAKEQNVDNGPYCVGWTNDITHRLRGPRPEQHDLDLVLTVPIKSEALREAHSRMYGHLWEYTKNNIPWFYTDLDTIKKKLQFVLEYFSSNVVVKANFSEDFKNNFKIIENNA